MHGLLNSFILIRDFSQLFSKPQSQLLAQSVCSPRGGIGADGLVLLRSAPGGAEADLVMDFYNADGSQAEMCGNAVRCLAKYVDDTGLLRVGNTNPSSVKFETPAGLITTRLIENQESDAVVSVDMGKPVFDPLKGFPGGKFDFRKLHFTAISMGNPHAVAFLPADYDWDFNYRETGEALQKEGIFPEGVNVEFARVVNEGEIEVRVVERGAGETLACGTGACAVAAVYIRNTDGEGGKGRKSPSSVVIHLLGGDLTIDWKGSDEDSIEMIGPVKKVAAGTYFFEG